MPGREPWRQLASAFRQALPRTGGGAALARVEETSFRTQGTTRDAPRLASGLSGGARATYARPAAACITRGGGVSGTLGASRRASAGAPTPPASGSVPLGAAASGNVKASSGVRGVPTCLSGPPHSPFMQGSRAICRGAACPCFAAAARWQGGTFASGGEGCARAGSWHLAHAHSCSRASCAWLLQRQRCSMLWGRAARAGAPVSASATRSAPPRPHADVRAARTIRPRYPPHASAATIPVPRRAPVFPGPGNTDHGALRHFPASAARAAPPPRAT
jgi:hypothetical protein